MILEIKNLSVDLGEFKLYDVDLKVCKKDYFSIIGPTGSGKSILLEAIAGFYKPLSGKIFLEGRDITNLQPEKRGISIVYQDFVLFPHINVLKNIMYGLNKNRKIDKNYAIREVKRLAEILEIQHLLHRKPTTLSGGEQQRVAIARALIVRPKLLLMDEPFSALDSKMKENLRYLVKKVVEEYDTTVLHVTHDFDDVFSLANKVAVMKDGRILQAGKLDEVFNKPLNDFIADFVGTNILRGVVVDYENGLTLIKVGDFILRSKDNADIGKNVRISIRPENLMVIHSYNSNMPSQGMNLLPCVIKDVIRETNLIWLILECGNLSLKAVTTPGLIDLTRKKVFISFNASCVNIIK